MTDDDLASLATAAKEGDADAFASLAERAWPRLVRFARSIVGDIEAEDVTQDALLAAWQHLPELEDPRSFDAWLTRIVYRRAVSGLRRWRRWLSRRAPDAGGAQLPGEAGRGREIEGELWVWQVLEQLAPRQRAVLHLTVVEGMTDGEIGAALGLRAGSVRAHRRRARDRVRRMLGRDTAAQPAVGEDG